jgi:hypothetical protein
MPARRRSSRGWSVGGLGAALLATALVALAAGPQAQAEAASATVTIKAGSRIHDFTHPVRITGRVASHRSGVRLTLYANTFPFPGEVVAGQTSTHRAGTYRFKVKADLATRYSVALSQLPTVRSRTLTAYASFHGVSSTCNLCGHGQHLGGPQTLRVSYRWRYPAAPFAAESIKPHYFYYGQTNGSPRAPTRLRLVKTVTPSALGDSTISTSISHRIRLPVVGLWSFRYLTCTKNTEAIDGFGLPAGHHCGDRKITLRPNAYFG